MSSLLVQVSPATAGRVRTLFDLIGAFIPIGLREWALLGVLPFNSVRVGVVVGRGDDDYDQGGICRWFCRYGKGGEFPAVLAQHDGDAYRHESIVRIGSVADRR